MALHFFSWVCISSCALHSGHALRRDDGEYSPGSGEEVVGGDGSIGVAEQPEDQRVAKILSGDQVEPVVLANGVLGDGCEVGRAGLRHQAPR